LSGIVAVFWAILGSRRNITVPQIRPPVRKGQGAEQLSRVEFSKRFRERFYDPSFDSERVHIERLLEIAWKNYSEGRKAPRTSKAGPGFADPDYDLSDEWRDTQLAIRKAAAGQQKLNTVSRILLICASSRNDKTCPGEMSKTFRLVQLARETLEHAGLEVDVLDLSSLAAEYGLHIHPCKACVSTAMPLCHWPCSCYPNHSLGQTNDAMNGIYPRWVAAHGVMVIAPVYWYQAPSGMKLMMERLVCADGGNPDPTSTHGKDPQLAKELELQGWDYPRHLAGRAFSVIVHGDSEGADTLRRSLVDWFSDLKMIQAGNAAVLDRYIGYYEPYATSHEALDRDTGMQQEVRNAATSLARAVQMIRAGTQEPDAELAEPRPK